MKVQYIAIARANYLYSAFNTPGLTKSLLGNCGRAIWRLSMMARGWTSLQRRCERRNMRKVQWWQGRRKQWPSWSFFIDFLHVGKQGACQEEVLVRQVPCPGVCSTGECGRHVCPYITYLQTFSLFYRNAVYQLPQMNIKNLTSWKLHPTCTCTQVCRQLQAYNETSYPTDAKGEVLPPTTIIKEYPYACMHALTAMYEWICKNPKSRGISTFNKWGPTTRSDNHQARCK